MIRNDIVPIPIDAASGDDASGEGEIGRFARACERFAAMNEPTAGEIAAFADTMIDLLDRVPEASLGTLARRLAHTDDAPSDLLDAIVARGGAPAAYVLRHSRAYCRRRLAELAFILPAELACLVAGRADLDAPTALALAQRPEPAVALALATNQGALFDADVCRTLARRARKEAELEAALRRRPVDPKTGAALVLQATPDIRAEIIRRARVEDMLGPRRDLAGVADDDFPDRVERLALAGDRAALVVELAQAVGCTVGDVEAFLRDGTGEAAAILFAAAGITAPTAARIFLSEIWDDPRSSRAVHGLVSIVANLSQRAARRLVGAMCGGFPELRGNQRHMPVYEAGSVPLRGTPADRRRPAAQPALKGRSGQRS